MNHQAVDDPRGWTSAQVESWLRDTLSLSEEIIQLFVENEVDGQVLLGHHLDHETLKGEFQIEKFGARCKVLSAIKQLEEHQRSMPATPTVKSEETRSPLFGDVSGILNKFDEEPLALTSRTTQRVRSPPAPDFVAEDENIEIRLLETPLVILDDAEGDEEEEERKNDRYRDDCTRRIVVSESSYEEPLADVKMRASQRRRLMASTTVANIQSSPNSTTRLKASRRVAPAPISTMSGSLPHPASTSKAPPSSSAASPRDVVRSCDSEIAPLQKGPASRNQEAQYLESRGVSLDDFLLDVPPGPPSDDEIKEWAVYMGRRSNQKKSSRSQHMRPGNKDIIQRNIRRILRQPPIFYDVPGQPGAIVYAPIRRRQGANVPVKLFTAIENGGNDDGEIQASTWDEVFANTATTGVAPGSGPRRTEIAMNNDGSTTEIQFGGKSPSTSRHLGEKVRNTSAGWLQPSETDTILPVYGESDTDDYSTDEDLLREIAQEEREKLAKLDQALSPISSLKPKSSSTTAGSKRLTTAEIGAVVQEHIQLRRERWCQKSQPTFERRAYRTFRKKGQSQKDIEEELKYLENKRLPEWQRAIEHGRYQSREAVVRACGAFDNTIDLICELQWKLQLFNGPEPAKPDMASSRLTRDRKDVKAAGIEGFPKSDDDTVMEEAGPTDSTAPELVLNGDHWDHDVTLAGDGGEAVDEEDESDLEEDALEEEEEEEDDLDDFIVHDTDEEEHERARNKDPATEEKRRRQPEASAKGRKDIDKQAIATLSPSSSSSALRRRNDDAVSTVSERSEIEDNPASNLTRTTTKKMRSLSSLSAPQPLPSHAAEEKKQHQLAKHGNNVGCDEHEGMAAADVIQVDQLPTLSASVHNNDSHDDGKIPHSPSPSSRKSHPASQHPSSPPTSEPSSPTDVELQLFGRKSPIQEEARGMDALSRRIDLVESGWLANYSDDNTLIAALKRVRKKLNTGNLKEKADSTNAIAVYLEYIDWKTFAIDGYDDDFRGFLQWKRHSGQTRDDLLRDLREKQKEESRLRAVEQAREEAARKEREEQARRRRQEAEAARRQAEREMEREKTLQQAKAAQEATITIIDSDSDSADGGSSRNEKGRSRAAVSTTEKVRGNRSTAYDDDNSDDDDNDINNLDDDEVVPSVIPAKRLREGEGRGRRGRGRGSKRHLFKGKVLYESTDEQSSANEQSDHAEDFVSHRRKMAKTQPRPRPTTGRRIIERDIVEPEDVIRLRQTAAETQKALEERIKMQKQRSKEKEEQRVASGGDGGNEVIDMENLVNAGFKEHERPIYFPPWMASQLKPHQKEGVRFMWRNAVMFKGGCILAHAMGLGKTFQIVAFIYLLIKEVRQGNPDIPKNLAEGAALIVCPATVAQNWAEEFRKWIPEDELDEFSIFSFGKEKIPERIMMLQKWRSLGGIFIMGNEMFRDMAIPKEGTPQSQPDIKSHLCELLLDPGPSVVVLDESHSLKNKNAKLSLVAKQIRTKSRIALTGYPLQNRLEEYWNMVDFVRPNYLGDLRTFRANYVTPIERGLFPDSTPQERKFAQKRLKVLTDLIKDFVLRKDQSVLVASLPKKVEYVVACSLTSLQRLLYVQYLEKMKEMRDISGDKGVLAIGQVLLTICNHPAIFKHCLTRVRPGRPPAQPAATTTPSMTVPGTHNTPSSSESALTPSAAPLEALTQVPPVTITGTEPILIDESDEDVQVAAAEVVAASSHGFQYDWSTIDDLDDVVHSNKMTILADILKWCHMLGEKTLVFSRSIPTLDYIERHICKTNDMKYMRIDGDTQVQYRQWRVHEFNKNQAFSVFLISTGSGSQGINLIGANRVILVDVGWNPSVDEQAVARCFRYGQTKPVYVYRLMTHGTWEDKLHKINVHKLGLSKRVIDEKNTVREFHRRQMDQYFEPPPEVPPKWASSDERVERFFRTHPDTDEQVIHEVINWHSDTLTLINPQSQYIREEQSDLTQADKDDIQKMLQEEKMRIHYANNPQLRPTAQPTIATAIMQGGQEYLQRLLQQQPPIGLGIEALPPDASDKEDAPYSFFSTMIDFAQRNSRITSNTQLPTPSAATQMMHIPGTGTGTQASLASYVVSSSSASLSTPTTSSGIVPATTIAGSSSTVSQNAETTVISVPASSTVGSSYPKRSTAPAPDNPEALQAMHRNAPDWKTPELVLQAGDSHTNNIHKVMAVIETLSPQDASMLSGLAMEVFAEQPEIVWEDVIRLTGGSSTTAFASSTSSTPTMQATIDVYDLPPTGEDALRHFLPCGGYFLHEEVHPTGLRRATLILLNPKRRDLHDILPPQPEAREGSRMRLPTDFTPMQLLLRLKTEYGEYFTGLLGAILAHRREAFKFVFVNLRPEQESQHRGGGVRKRKTPAQIEWLPNS